MNLGSKKSAVSTQPLKEKTLGYLLHAFDRKQSSEVRSQKTCAKSTNSTTGRTNKMTMDSRDPAHL